MNEDKIAIVGYGWVGKSMEKLFPKAYVYDPLVGKGDSKERVNECDISFVCVPTPNTNHAALDTSIVEECVSWCKTPTIVIRSTVNPGTCDRLEKKYGKNLVMQPEYLGETVAHPLINPTERNFIIIGGKPEHRRKVIETYQLTYNANTNIRQVSNLEAEVIKVSENRAIAFKVAECQELYDVCEKAGIDYYTIREAVYSDDPRFNLWWSFVYPDKRGFQSKCIPKDIYAWCSWAESLGYDPKITRMILDKNEDWLTSNER